MEAEDAQPDAEGQEEVPQPNESFPAVFPPEASEHRVNDGGASGTILRLLTLYPFRALHDKWSDVPLKGRARAEYTMEFVLTTVGVIVVLGVAALVAYKAIFPLPNW